MSGETSGFAPDEITGSAPGDPAGDGPIIMVDGVPKPISTALRAGMPTAPDPPPPCWVIRTLAWTGRLTEAELGGITLAASRGLEQGDPTLQVFLDDLGRATVVDLKDPRFVGGLSVVSRLGLIDAERIPALLGAAAPGEEPY